MKVAVLMGGWSAERAVSLSSGAGVAAACRALGHHVSEIDMDRDVAERLRAAAPDVVFNALHGTPGEDGSVQGLLDILGLPYTHSGCTTSAIAIDKQLTKAVLAPAGVRMPGGQMVSRAQLFAGDPLPRPYVLKPVNEGSSVGVAIITADTPVIGPDVPGPWQDFETLLAEPFIAGLELTVAVIDAPEGPRALAVTELRPGNGFYDYEAKYTDGVTEHICPAVLPADIEAAALETAVRAHLLLGCRGTSRADYRWDPAHGVEGLYLLEVNTQPGMTPLSLVPEQARHVGMSYEALVQRLLDVALDGGPR
ncbi:MAG: D-alanine--D-alanine ligase [Polymorphobacter sp.]|uniref:D-alanine--D-alanine ligase n=1 Tax=Polymorphobacter sp. TaxID=1909290 RepID=UPI003A83A020